MRQENILGDVSSFIKLTQNFTNYCFKTILSIPAGLLSKCAHSFIKLCFTNHKTNFKTTSLMSQTFLKNCFEPSNLHCRHIFFSISEKLYALDIALGGHYTTEWGRAMSWGEAGLQHCCFRQITRSILAKILLIMKCPCRQLQQYLFLIFYFFISNFFFLS